MTRNMSAADFKAKCLEVLDQVAETGRTVVVTKRGRPVAQVVPIVRKPDTLFGALKDDIRILGDIEEPIAVEWTAAKK